MKKIVVGLFLVFLIFIFVSPLNAQEKTEGNLVLKDENLILLEVELNNLGLKDEFLTAYRFNETVLLPIGQLLAFLELPFKIIPEQGLVEGFIWEEAEKYSLNLNQGIAISNGREFSLNKYKTEVDWDDIYLETELISEWLPFSLELDLFRATLTVETEKPLPIQEKIDRRYRWDRLSNRTGRAERPIYPAVENPYSLFNGPFVDHRLYFSGDSTPRHYTNLAGDIFYLNGRLFISGPLDDPLEDVSGRLGRRSPDPDLLGPLNAHEFWLGDLSQSAVSDISSWESVQGISVSSYPYSRSRDFYSHSLEGELPENWEVELYDNGNLIDYQTSNEEERYRFENIPISYGINEFTLVFYDEFGRKYEEVKKIRVDSTLIPPGENRYQFEIGSDDQDQNRISVEFSRGINPNLSLVTNYVRLPISDQTEDFLRLGLRTSLSQIYLEANYLNALDGGQGAELGFSTDLSGTRINLTHAEFDDYRSETVSNLNRRTSLDLRRIFPFLSNSSLGVRLDLTREENYNGDILTEVYNRLSTSYKKYSFINRLNLQLQEDETEGSGDFAVRTRMRDYRLQGNLGYDINPFDLETVSADLSGYLNADHRFNLGFTRNLDRSENTYSAGIVQDVDYYSWGINTSYRDDGDFTVAFSFSTSFGRDDFKEDPYHLALGPSAREGAVLVTSYLDTGEEKKPVEAVAFKINGRTADVRTNENGKAFIYGLRPDLKTDIAIDLESLTDPFLVSDPEGVSFVPRAGQTFYLELPVIMTGELGGYVYLDRGESTSGIRNIEVQLLDSENNVVRSTLTAYDGYFYLAELRPGNYLLRISPEALARRELVENEVQEISIPKSGGYLNDLQVILKRK